MNPSKRYVFSLYCTNRSSLQQSGKRESDFIANYPSLANIITVSTTATQLTVQIPLLLPKTQNLLLGPTPGMGSLSERLHAEGVSKDSAAHIANARRSGTNAHYKSVCRKWHSWCYQRQIDPIKCSVNKVLQFLTECYNMGYEHSTIAGVRSAISAYHDPINGIPIGKESRISALLAGVFNIRPPQPRMSRKSLTSLQL